MQRPGGRAPALAEGGDDAVAQVLREPGRTTASRDRDGDRAFASGGRGEERALGAGVGNGDGDTVRACEFAGPAVDVPVIRAGKHQRPPARPVDVGDGERPLEDGDRRVCGQLRGTDGIDGLGDDRDIETGGGEVRDPAQSDGPGADDQRGPG